MDNNAFKDLVRSKVKSTKEIAREAVEEAFIRKRKRKKGKGRRGDDDDLSSSDSDSDDNRRGKQAKHNDSDKQQLFKPGAVKRAKDGDKKEAASKYRDRAKERREGKNDDYKDSETLLKTVTQGEDGETALDQAEISKYLGGDEAHTHLVKGLDVALARSVRGQKVENQQEGEDEEKEDLLKDLKPFDSLEEAWNFIREENEAFSDFTSTRTKSALGRSMLQYPVSYTHLTLPTNREV